jgi:hypothetical protein
MSVSNVSTIDANTWQLISTNTISSATSNVTFSSLSGYKTYLVAGKNITKSAAAETVMQLNGDTAAGSYGVYDYSLNYFYVGGAVTTVSALWGLIEDADQAAPHKVYGTYNYVASSGPYYYTNPTAITSIKVYPFSGNFTGGTIYLYGIAS